MKTEYLFLITALCSLLNIVIRVYIQEKTIKTEREVYHIEQEIKSIKLENQILENQIDYYTSLYYVRQKALEAGYKQVQSYIIIN